MHHASSGLLGDLCILLYKLRLNGMLRHLYDSEITLLNLLLNELMFSIFRLNLEIIKNEN